jgi:hypothetical protein
MKNDVAFLYSQEEENMDHQTIAQLLGNYGEFLGSIGVLATLIYLAAQIRNSNKYEAARHIDVHMDRIRERFLLVAQNEDLAKIDRIANEGGDLDEDQAWRWRALAIHHILCMRDAWLRAGFLGTVTGQKPFFYLDLLVEALKQRPAFREVWDAESRNNPNWSDEFVEYVNEKLKAHST